MATAARCYAATMPSLRRLDDDLPKNLPAFNSLQAKKTHAIGDLQSQEPHLSIPTTIPIYPKNSGAALTACHSNGPDVSFLASNSSFSAANVAPPEILLQIFAMLTPRDFDNARRTCSQWMRVGMNQDLLESMLKRAGWWDAYRKDTENWRNKPPSVSDQSDAWRMSKRFATECLLAGRKTNIEGPGFMATQVVDFSALAHGLPPAKNRRVTSKSQSTREKVAVATFSISNCSNYVLVTAGCKIHVFRLLTRKSEMRRSVSQHDADLTPIITIDCAFEVLAAVLDTSGPRFVVAALLKDRVGMVCEIETPTKTQFTSGSVNQDAHQMSKGNQSRPHYYYNICSEDHPPRTIALYPGRRCVAFGCAGGIEIHWVDEATQQDQRRHFPMSQPSESLHFLPNTSGSLTEMRLISSLAGPGVHECACRHSPHPDHPKKCQFHTLANVQPSSRKGTANNSALSLVRATHCHHYRAVPVNDGFHMAFIDPRTGFLCIGSDTPIGGPTSLTRAFVCVPPFPQESPADSTDTRIPTVFTVGSDLDWGLRVVAAYDERIVLYSVPLDVLNVIRKERQRQGDGVMGDSDLIRDWFIDPERCRKRRESLIQNQNGDWEFLLSVRYRPETMIWPFKIYGKEIGKVENIVELALQSENGGARVWAFSADGKSTVFDIDTFTSSSGRKSIAKCNHITVGSDGNVESARSNNSLGRTNSSIRATRKRKFTQSHDDFVGRYGACHFVPSKALDGHHPETADPAASQNKDASIRRPSFAACIVDFKITEFGIKTAQQ